MADSSGLHFVLVKAELQVVAGLMYTLRYKGNVGNGVCQVTASDPRNALAVL